MIENLQRNLPITNLVMDGKEPSIAKCKKKQKVKKCGNVIEQNGKSKGYYKRRMNKGTNIMLAVKEF